MNRRILHDAAMDLTRELTKVLKCEASEDLFLKFFPIIEQGD